MADFKTIRMRPMTGAFDTLSSADEVGFGNWRVVKNAVTRSTRNRERGGGWRRLFADDVPYNNQDLHDQLTDRLGYYDQFDSHASGGGGLGGYTFPYFWPAQFFESYTFFPPAEGPFCPVYSGDFADGLYEGCQIVYPFTGYPHALISANVDITNLLSHWRMDTLPTVSDVINTNDLSVITPPPVVAAGKHGDSIFLNGGALRSTAVDIRTWTTTSGFTGWVHRENNGLAHETVLSVWGSLAGQWSYRLYIQNNQFIFETSTDGTATNILIHPATLNDDEWFFVACWWDAINQTINLKVNDQATVSSGGITAIFGGLASLLVGTDGPGNDLDGRVDTLSFWKNGFPTEAELGTLYWMGDGDDFPFSVYSDYECTTGFPFYYINSSVYISCVEEFDDAVVPGYPYGPGTPFYDPIFSYDYTYCGNYLYSRPACREAITMLAEVVTPTGRKLLAGTMSRVYEFNQSAGNWRVLADGLGNSGYTTEQCGCNAVRGTIVNLGAYVIFTNNFDAPAIYLLGDDPSQCGLQALLPITDLAVLGISRAGGVVTWKGFVIFFDITEGGVRSGGTILWSDLENPTSFIESDVSFAGRAIVAVGDTILAAAPIGNWLILYTDKAIIRVSLVGGDDVFNFEEIYRGGNALKYKYSLVNTGDSHVYMGQSDIYVFTQFDTRPINVDWITKAAGFVFDGITEDDATYSQINEEACDLVSGGWNEVTREVFMSWPTGNNICPDVTLRLNIKFGTADLVDHGFSAFLTFHRDERPTIGEWIEELGICPPGSKVATGVKDGPVCPPYP